ncbi:AsmA-like C-terminal domain-containing protein [Arcobacter vandammei]|uniref:YhdP family protein n=1 Tax=Arcobacter vandammei TaxID=2782243 RepID=UPI0018DF5DBA
MSQFYIKLDKKLIVRVESIEFTTKKSEVSSSIDDIKKNIDLLPKAISFFQEIYIKSLKIDGNEFSVFLDNDDLYLDNKYINLVSNLNKSSKQVEFNIQSLYLKDYDVLLEGLIKLDYFKNEIKYYGDIHYKGVVARTNIDISKEKLKFFTISQYFENLNFLKPLLDLPQTANEWMYDNVSGDFKLDWFYGEFDLDKNKIIEKSLQGEAHIKDAKIMFHKDVDKIITQNVKVKFKNNTLHFDLIDANFKNKELINSYVTIRNLTDEINGVVDVNIETNSKLDSDILGILKAYDITLPVLQKSGTTKAKLLLSFPYDEKKDLNSKGEFLVENSEIMIDNFAFRSKSAKVLLENDFVFVKDASFLLDDMIDANADLKINTNNLKIDGNVHINKLFIEDTKKNNILDIRDFKTPITMDFLKTFDIHLLNLHTNIKFEDKLFVVVEDVSKVYNYSKLLQDYSIKSGNLVLKIMDDKHYNFEALITGFDFPLYKNNKKLEELYILGEIKDNNISIHSKNEDIKVDIKDKIDIFLKDLTILDTFSNSKNLDFNEKIDVNLENCEFIQEDDTYNLKSAKVFIAKDEINFEASLKDFDSPLKKDDNFVKDFDVKGEIKNSITKIDALNDELKIELKDDSLKLDLSNLDVVLDFKTSNKLKYQKILINANNSNIIVNEDYKILAENYIINLDDKEKFIYLKHKESELSFKEYEDEKIDIFAVNLSEEFLNSLVDKQIINGGTINFYAKGSYHLLDGKLLIKDSSLSNLSILSNLLAFVETTPAIAAQLITLPFNPLLALPTAGIGLKNIGVYTLKEGNMEFSYNKDENIIKIENLNTIGNGIDFEGFGVIDLNDFTIYSKINLIFLKDYTSFVRYIPLVNYILLGDKERVETLIDVYGSLDNPKISTNLVKDSFSAPVNIFKRVFTAPINIFNNINLENR